MAIILAPGRQFRRIRKTYIISTFVPSYATTQLGVPRSVILTGLMLTSMVMFAEMDAGALASRMGTRPVAFAGALLACLFPFPFSGSSIPALPFSSGSP